MGYRALLIGLLVTALAYAAASRFIPMDPWTAAEAVNAQTLPTLYGGLLGIVLLILLARPAPAVDAPDGYRLLRLAGMGALVLGFALLTAWIDLWVALGLFLATACLWLGERRWLPVAALAAGVPVLGWLGIELALGVYLPD